MQLTTAFQRVDKTQIKNIAAGMGAPVVVLAIMGMVILPMPAILLDVLFSFNIALSLVIILVSVFTKRPIDFGIFPLVLLVATVLRLALNVASTRIVLIQGHEGGDAAGKVIQAFGEVVIGGNYVVGVVVFAILLIINFKVVTAGAGRISEVSARFTLDAMPGKQMAIDADLNAGYIDQDQARKRREEITTEADFYGSMDGASKFVKGDAIAGLFIMLINIVGGLFIGMFQHDLPFSNAMEVYTILTIGDGLVAQIPSLLLSVATAIIVTRENDSQEMGHEIREQLANRKALYITSAILFIMGIVPGMPHVAFLSFSFLVGGYAFFRDKMAAKQAAEKALVETMPESNNGPAEIKELDWDDVQQVDTIGLEVGYRLIPLVDKAQGGELLTRIKGVRKKLSQELGFLIPPVHIRDNLDFSPNAYSISMMGVSIGDAEISHDNELAINPGQVFGELSGTKTTDPAFGLEAVWIKANQREHAQTLGYTVVDSATVVATHLSQLLTTNAYQLLGHEEVQQLLDMLEKSNPKLVEGLVPDILSLSTVVKVLQTLLYEGVPIRDMRTICQTLCEYGPKSQDPDVLVSALRIALKRLIVQDITDGGDEIPVITLAPDLEQMLHQSLQAGGEDGSGIEPGLAEKIQQSLTEASQQQELAGEPAVLLTSGMLRPVLSRFLKHSVVGLHVLSYQEIPDDKQIKIVSSVGQ
ncbi:MULTISPECIES: flagellar biosynthesis protein FlhA [Alteromonadaceae]|jgi:flagellar biosynthesis protein FlhA|uniref:Flagellar biosynthesis protein FlhA n=1 Tax=Brumicola blandensis TaxID=3075611 RepID=A0AAW8R6P3_9ALTE|nr:MULTISPECIES: flagellar biosynthesis protein FlhA [unclassified Alteromonas]MDT0582853.1 flagellar biosynthesis protein FlhA [Alteromonas sp. W409]MDT0628269.1 flagellar biosynthesis protein FlhA [Alteromonas sp. W364]